MKAIFISIKPKWCALMMNGDKTIEVRKGTALYKAIQKLIDEYGYADIYGYCTKGKKNYLYWDWYDPPYVEEEWFVSSNPKIWSDDRRNINGPFNGKVIFKFRCYKVEEIETIHDRFDEEIWYSTGSMQESDILEHSCLNRDELDNYLYGEKGTAIHISDLEIFDKPKELSEFKQSENMKCNKCKYFCKHCFRRKDDGCTFFKFLTKAPQSWCYIESID